MRLLLPCWTLWAGSESRSHLLSRRAGQLRREMRSGEQCASADDCTSAASVDTAGPWRSPPGTLPSGACLLLSLPGRRGYGRWGVGSRVQGHGSCELFSSSPPTSSFTSCIPGPGWSPRAGDPWAGPAHHAEEPHHGCCYDGVFMGLGFQHGASWRAGWRVAAGSAVSPGALGVRGGGSLRSLRLFTSACIWLVCLPSLTLFLLFKNNKKLQKWCRDPCSLHLASSDDIALRAGRTRKVEPELLCRESCLWVEAGAQIQTAVCLVWPTSSVYICVLPPRRERNQCPPTQSPTKPPSPSPSLQKAVLGLPCCLGRSF